MTKAIMTRPLHLSLPIDRSTLLRSSMRSLYSNLLCLVIRWAQKSSQLMRVGDWRKIASSHPKRAAQTMVARYSWTSKWLQATNRQEIPLNFRCNLLLCLEECSSKDRWELNLPKSNQLKSQSLQLSICSLWLRLWAFCTWAWGLQTDLTHQISS